MTNVISIDMMAQMIMGIDDNEAFDLLEYHGFSLSEASEIIMSHTCLSYGLVSGSMSAIANTIKSTIETSIKMGDRLDYSIGYG